MGSEIQVFIHPQFGEVRGGSDINGAYLIASDFCYAIGIKNSRDVTARLDEDEKGVCTIDTPGGKQEFSTIYETGCYRAIMTSRSDRAKSFQRWASHEVFPSIFRNGAYIAGQEKMDDAQLIAHALIAAQNIIEQRDARIAVLEPKGLFADAVSASSSCILIGELAKILKQNGIEIGQNRLYERLREEGYLMRTGTSYNMPTQRSMELGLFQVKERTINNPDGSVRITRTTMVTGKGQQYFINHFLNERAVV